MGATSGDIHTLDYYLVSIHAPVMGATEHGPKRNTGCTVSIHAPVMGATMLFDLSVCHPDVSIHAPVMGATQGYIGG